MDKREELARLKAKMEADESLPLRKGATQLVFGEGNPDAAVYLLGEAPGYYEDRDGRPFVGLAGQLLNKLIATIGLKREDVYISNVVRFRPPANRDPEPAELAAFAPYVAREIEIINPKVIVTLGRFSMNKFLPDARISTVHGRKFVVNFNGQKKIVLPMYHPAAALRNGAIMKLLEGDFLMIKNAMKEEVVQDLDTKSEKADNSQLSLI